MQPNIFWMDCEGLGSVMSSLTPSLWSYLTGIDHILSFWVQIFVHDRIQNLACKERQQWCHDLICCSVSFHPYLIKYNAGVVSTGY